MINIKKFTFNPFQENTYLLYDETNEAVIIDPGCFDADEEKQLADFIDKNDLTPIKLLITHAHIDHILGNKFVASKYDLKLEAYQSEYPMLQMAKKSAELYNIPYQESPEAEVKLEEGEKIKFGNSELDILFVPGHAPDHLVFLNKEQKIMIGGDVLFQRSIGRTDLPGGNHQQLIKNIKDKIFTLDEAMVVYPGHGENTTIGEEKRENPFF